MFERFTDNARKIVVDAQRVSNERNHGYTGTEHILLAIMRSTESHAFKIVNSLDIELESVQQSLEKHLSSVVRESPSHQGPFTTLAKGLIQMALRESLHTGANYIGTEHLLLGMLRDPDSDAVKILVSHGVTYENVLEEYLRPTREFKAANGRVHILVRGDTVTLTINANATVSVDSDAIVGEEFILKAQDECVVTVTAAD